jgi:sugar transferase (PEP-CTERM system associated)
LMSLEMAVLGLCELALSFVVIYGVLTWPGVLPALVEASSVGAAHAASLDIVNLAAVLAITVVLTAAAIGLYRPEICVERRRLLVNAGVAGILAFPVVLVVSGTFDIGWSRHSVVLFTKVLVVWLITILVSRVVFTRIMRERWFIRRILVLGSVARITRLRQLATGGRGRLFEPVVPARDAGAGAIDQPLLPALSPPALSPDGLRSQRIWGIVVTRDPAAPASLPVQALLDCKLRGVPVFDEAGFCEQHLGRIDVDSLRPDWLLFADGFASGRASNLVKRGIDICVSLTLLLLTLPLMVLTALLIRLDSPGPVLYRQRRTGLHGRPFTLLKFRSMTVDAEQGGKPRWASQQDPRITRVGGFIRPMRIDELPQLINVLRGEMSMIGPRPERPHFVEQLARVIPLYSERSYVKPGITGWAQVNYPYGASVEDARQKLSYDLYYVKNRSLLLDLLILLATVRVILFREGAR